LGNVERSVSEQVAADVEPIVVVDERGQLFGLGTGLRKFVESPVKMGTGFGNNGFPFQQGLLVAAEVPEVAGGFLVSADAEGAEGHGAVEEAQACLGRGG